MSLDDFDARAERQERAQERKAERARARQQWAPPPPPPASPAAAPTPKSNVSEIARPKRAKPLPPRPEPASDKWNIPEPEKVLPLKPGQEAAAGPVVQLVDELPGRRGRGPSKVPPCRQLLIDTCKANPGRWVRYAPGDQDVKLSSLRKVIEMAIGGFDGGGFAFAQREGSAYVSWTEPLP